jgi:very-short-patch-repair endonuclease
MKFPLKTKKKRSELEDRFAQQLMDAGFRGRYRRNAQFIEGRKFAADFLFPALHLVVEVDGGEWMGKGGGHTSGSGFSADRARDNLAALQHIQTIRYPGGAVKDGTAIQHFIEYVPVRQREVEAMREKGLW